MRSHIKETSKIGISSSETYAKVRIYDVINVEICYILNVGCPEIFEVYPYPTEIKLMAIAIEKHEKRRHKTLTFILL